MDELVAYAKKIYGVDGLNAGSFDNFITFIQELTEAARASKRSLVVASIPESDNEIGGEAGQRALEQIEHTFGRMEAIWKPVAANEGFEVVRRRLFLDCKDDAARDEVCATFSKMYNENTSDFPVESRELEYRDRMVSCYPIHPEVFDRLYEDWATLEKFQRTRGVLRLMASVIHELWMNQDPSPMIMPGSFPLDVPGVRDELTRYLDDNWNAVVDSEIDGKQSVPYRNDGNNTRYGNLLASRRVARTIMLGSAPDVGGQSVRGIERAHIRLGTVQPGENISVFNDALARCRHLRLSCIATSTETVFGTIRAPRCARLPMTAPSKSRTPKRSMNRESPKEAAQDRSLLGIHVCPASSLDVPDDQTLRLVVLTPSANHRGKTADSAALTLASEILSNRGTSPRTYKNMVVFAAADASYYAQLLSEAKQYLAWDSIKKDRESLNLDVAQTRETDQSVRRADESLAIKIQEPIVGLFIRVLTFSATRWISFGKQNTLRAAAKISLPRWRASLFPMRQPSRLGHPPCLRWSSIECSGRKRTTSRLSVCGSSCALIAIFPGCRAMACSRTRFKGAWAQRNTLALLLASRTIAIWS